MEAFVNTLGVVAGVFSLAVLLATVNERLIEKLAKPVITRFTAAVEYVGLVAIVTGAAISIGFGVDLFSPLATAVGVQMTAPWAGIVLTGIVVGGGSNFIHDIWPDGEPKTHPTTVINT